MTDFIYRQRTEAEIAQDIHNRIGCGPIVTADDPDDDPNGFDAELLGPTPNGYQYGYCPLCRKTWRWDVREQRWVPYAPVPR